MAMMVARYDPGAPIPRTYREAFNLVTRHGMGLFGSKNIHELDK